MNRGTFLQRRTGLLLMLALVGVLIFFAGCSSPDAENQAYRPWGGAQGYQSGLPSSLMEGR